VVRRFAFGGFRAISRPRPAAMPTTARMIEELKSLGWHVDVHRFSARAFPWPSWRAKARPPLAQLMDRSRPEAPLSWTGRLPSAVLPDASQINFRRPQSAGRAGGTIPLRVWRPGLTAQQSESMRGPAETRRRLAARQPRRRHQGTANHAATCRRITPLPPIASCWRGRAKRLRLPIAQRQKS